MRRLFRLPYVRLVTFLAKGILRRYRPTVIAVTGSVGKTLTKEAIFQVLNGSFSVWKSEHNLNTEVGVPLAIFGVRQVPHRAGEWWAALTKGWGVRFGRGLYPELLVLEFAADRPGDIALLSRLAQPRVGVVTAVGATHLLRFGTLEGVAREKGELVRSLPPDGFAVLNADDPLVAAMAQTTDATVATYGVEAKTEIRAEKLKAVVKPRTLDAIEGGEPVQLNCSLVLEGKSYPLALPGFVAPYQVMSALVAAAVGRAFDVEPETIVRRLARFRPLNGRMRVLRGVNQAILLDDSYNASPLAAKAALKVLSHFPKAKRRIAVLGEMAELGTTSGAAHEEIGRLVADSADVLVAVGPNTRGYIEGALAEQMAGDALLSVPDAAAAGEWLRANLRTGDVVLLKGSQVSRMEKAAAAALLEPGRAAELLVRQDDYWLRR